MECIDREECRCCLVPYIELSCVVPQTMPAHRIKQLESIGFEWRVRPQAMKWEQRYQELLDYKRTYGDCNVPQVREANNEIPGCFLIWLTTSLTPISDFCLSFHAVLACEIEFSTESSAVSVWRQTETSVLSLNILTNHPLFSLQSVAGSG